MASGLQAICDNIIAQNSVQGKPVCYVGTYAVCSKWGYPLIGFQPLILAAEVNLDNNNIFWNPIPETASWLVKQLFPMMAESERGDRVLAHLTLKGNFIWAANDPDCYLDGNAFDIENPNGEPSGSTSSSGLIRTDLRFPSGDGRRGGDFEMWFWLIKLV